jgi:1-acyl-sn-glycerol-3-phosphate acyltransferase
MIWAAGLMKLVYLLPLSKGNKEAVCLTLVQFAWWGSLVLSPWLRYVRHPSSDNWADIMSGTDTKVVREKPASDGSAKTEVDRPLFLLGNHTSFFDTLFVCSMIPNVMVRKVRTYMKNDLFNLPLLGTICRSVGHFPVYFAAAEDGKFTLDATKMVSVEENVDKHLSTGGWLTFFPEGQLNKSPDKLLPLRYGGFKRALEFDGKLAAFVTHGNPAIWPVKAAVGGFPGRVCFSTKVLAPNGARAFAADLRKKAEAEGRDNIPADYVLLSEAVEVMMQSQYDLVKAANEGKASLKQD